jgi:regulator of protease activity HflC (stomatin/prohibitin superfamily)
MRAARFVLAPEAKVTRFGPFLKVVIFDYQRGLLYIDGRFDRVLFPGRYRFIARTDTVRVVDARPQYVTIPGQEVLTADGVTIKLTIAAGYEVADFDVAYNKVAFVDQALYLTLQIALRRIVGEVEVADLLTQRAQIGDRLVELARDKVAETGLRLIEADVKDILFPGELKRIFAQVVQARQEGLAALEKARGETAALRNLANAARLVEANPALLQLRLLQTVQATPGATLVIGAPDAVLPKAKRAK